ncbi:MAG: hypothetical protein WD073_05500, partial [Xanthobacteraceae bacterium]
MATVHVWTNMDSDAPRRSARTERRRLRLSTLERRSGLDHRRDVLLCQRNGKWVRQRYWHRTLAGRNDVVHFIVVPGKGDAVRTVASIAILIAATIIAGPVGGSIAGALGVTSAAGIAAITAATTATLAIAGNFALNAIIPPARPDAPGLATSLGEIDANAPTYAFTVSSQQNLARLGGRIPEWFGYHRVIPDVASTAWHEWADGRQTLYQTLCCTKGELEIEKIELGRTPIDTFEDIDYQVFGPGATADLFESEVYQASDVGSILLTAPNELVAPDDGVYGPFAALPPGQASQRFGLDVSFPSGLYLSSGASLAPKTAQWRVEARKIDEMPTIAAVYMNR